MKQMLIYYYEDEVSGTPFGGQHYQALLNHHAHLNCELFPPPEFEELDELTDHPPDLFLIDYELSKVQQGGRKVSYKGQTLAAELRGRFPELPILLTTNEGVLGGLSEATERQLLHMADFDALIKKETFVENPEKTREEVFQIAQGFQHLITISRRNWKALSDALDASEEEKELLQEAAPPLFGDRWVTVEAAGWIRNTILRFPGILYDPVHAATHLGISLESFEKSEVQKLLHAAYNGVFAPTDGRWWRRRLTMIAQQLASDVQVSGPVNQAFCLAFHNRHGIDLDPALCIWDGTPVADWICCLRNEPVKIQHSLRYYPDYPDQRPAVMDEARISYRAIYEDEIDEDLVDPDERELISEIIEMTDPRES